MRLSLFALFFAALSFAYGELDEFQVYEDGKASRRRRVKPETGGVKRGGGAQLSSPTSRKSSTKGPLPPHHPSNTFNFPAGRIMQFHESVRPTALAFTPSRDAFLITDGHFHGDKYFIPQIRETLGWWPWLLWYLGVRTGESYSFAYLVSTEGQLMRTLEFVDRESLALGTAESEDKHAAFSFFQGPGLEVWTDTLELKMTYHELAANPALPVFDGEGMLWLPYTSSTTSSQGMSEEGTSAIVLWVYKRDGGKWETFHRRQFHGVKHPYTVHLDAVGRVAVAGVKEVGSQHTMLEFYTLSGDRKREEYTNEQRARWMSQSKATPKPGEAEVSIHLTAVPLLDASYTFPFPACLEALFILTGDGHAITACKGSPGLKVLRVGFPVRSPPPSESDEESEEGDGDSESALLLPEVERAQQALETLPGKKPIREAWAPFLPKGAASIRLYPSGYSVLVADVHTPYGISDIGGLAMAPDGNTFAILDSSKGRLYSVQWPWEGLQGEGEGGNLWDWDLLGPSPPSSVLNEAPTLPDEKLYTIPEPPRSS